MFFAKLIKLAHTQNQVPWVYWRSTNVHKRSTNLSPQKLKMSTKFSKGVFLLTLFSTASFLYFSKGEQAWGLTSAFIVKHTHKTGFFQSPQMFTKVHKFWAPKSSKCPQFTILYFSKRGTGLGFNFAFIVVIFCLF